jgi:hypothetical protein
MYAMGKFEEIMWLMGFMFVGPVIAVCAIEWMCKLNQWLY